VRIGVCSQNPLLQEDLAAELRFELWPNDLVMGTVQELLEMSAQHPVQAIVVDAAELSSDDRSYLAGAQLFSPFHLVVYGGPAGPPLSGSRVILAATVQQIVQRLASISEQLAGSNWFGEQSARPLSAREYEVARLVARGYTNSRIAETLALKENRVRDLVSDVLRKLRCLTRQEIGLALKSLDSRHLEE